MILLATDWHLDDQRANDYRWNVFDEVARVCQSRPVSKVYHLGDMVDRKDRHPGEMVNRLVACWTNIVDVLNGQRDLHVADEFVSILDGNHTRLLSGGSFWEFLSQVDGIEYVTRPTLRDDGDLLLLPFSANPRDEWRGLPIRDCRAIFAHATRTGTIAENGFTLTGQDLPPIPRSVRVYSGDVHNQQQVDNWTYVGASVPVKFGDDYRCRFLLLDEHTYEAVEEVAVDTISKRVLDVSTVDDLAGIDVRPGDQVRVRASVGPGGDWGALEAGIDAWAKARMVEVASIEGRYEVPAQSDLADDASQDPEAALRSFAAEEDVSSDLLDVGLELLREARG